MAFPTWKTLAVGGALGVVIGFAALSFVEPVPARAEASGQPVVVELFTSQSCYSCPPAEAYLNELADERDEVIALEWHVDYWDRLVYRGSAWKDVFSDPAFTERQRLYAGQVKGRGYSYTPQIIIDGTREAVGSDRTAVTAAIRAAATEPRLSVRATHRNNGALDIAVDGSMVGNAAIWVVTYLKSRTTDVVGGENKGKTLANNFVVRSIEQVGAWEGSPTAVSVPLVLEPEHGCVVLVQSDTLGPVIGAARCTDEGAGQS
ncbi:MAG: DUF1223 domain-containing protein [Alphaproteobacteria bacterium]